MLRHCQFAAEQRARWPFGGILRVWMFRMPRGRPGSGRRLAWGRRLGLRARTPRPRSAAAALPTHPIFVHRVGHRVRHGNGGGAGEGGGLVDGGAQLIQDACAPTVFTLPVGAPAPLFAPNNPPVHPHLHPTSTPTMPPATKFAALAEHAGRVRTQGGAIVAAPFLDLCREVLPVLAQFGPGLAIVKSDIGGNIGRLEAARERDPARFGELFAIPRDEVARGAPLDGHSDVKALLWLKRWVVLRAVGRGVRGGALRRARWPLRRTAQHCPPNPPTLCLPPRAMQFLADLLTRLGTDPGASVTGAAREAYAATLRPFHGMLTATAFSVALTVGKGKGGRGGGAGGVAPPDRATSPHAPPLHPAPCSLTVRAQQARLFCRPAARRGRGRGRWRQR